MPIVETGSYSVKDSGTGLIYGIGALYANDSWAVRLEWERFTDVGHSFNSETDLDIWSVGIEIRFSLAGRKLKS